MVSSLHFTSAAMKRVLALLAALALCLLVRTDESALLDAEAVAVDSWQTQLSTEVMSIINGWRADHGRPQLVPDQRLINLAYEQSQNMAARGTIYHEDTARRKASLDRAGYTDVRNIVPSESPSPCPPIRR